MEWTGPRMRWLRTMRLDMSKDQMAKEVGISRNILPVLEATNGTISGPVTDALTKLAKGAGVTEKDLALLDQLMTNEPSSTQSSISAPEEPKMNETFDPSSLEPWLDFVDMENVVEEDPALLEYVHGICANGHNGIDGVAVLQLDVKSKEFTVVFCSSLTSCPTERRPPKKIDANHLLKVAENQLKLITIQDSAGSITMFPIDGMEVGLLRRDGSDPVHDIQDFFMYVNFRGDHAIKFHTNAKRYHPKVSAAFSQDWGLDKRKDLSTKSSTKNPK